MKKKFNIYIVKQNCMIQTYTNITNKQIIPNTLHYAYLVLVLHSFKLFISKIVLQII